LKRELLKKGERAALKITLVVGAVSVLKIVTGLLTGSLVLLSDGFHSATDLLSTLTAFLGLKIAGKKPNKQFAFGFYKAENLATLVVGVLIFWVSLSFFKEGYLKLFEISQLKLPLAAFLVAFVAIGVDFFSYRFLKKAAKETNAKSLLANALDKRNDIFSSSLVFLSVGLSVWQIPYVEGLATIVIASLLLKVAFGAIKEGILSLLDAAPESNQIKEIQEAILAVNGIEDCFDLKLRQSGPFLTGDVKVGVRKQIDVARAHDLVDKIEKKLERKFSQIDSIVVHVEPFRSEFNHLCLPIEQKKGLESKLALTFARACFFLFVNLEGKRIKGFYFLKNPFTKTKIKTSLRVVELLVEQKSEILLTPQIGEIAFLALKQTLFDIFQTKQKTAQKAIDAFLKKELKELKQSTKKEK